MKIRRLIEQHASSHVAQPAPVSVNNVVIEQRVKKAMKHQLAEGIVEFIETEIIKNFGIPVEIITDQGRNFLSDAVAKLTQRHAINH